MSSAVLPPGPIRAGGAQPGAARQNLHSETRANLLLDKGRNFAGFSERDLSGKANWSDLQTVA
jgi:hypothetical protein